MTAAPSLALPPRVRFPGLASAAFERARRSAKQRLNRAGFAELAVQDLRRDLDVFVGALFGAGGCAVDEPVAQDLTYRAGQWAEGRLDCRSAAQSWRAAPLLADAQSSCQFRPRR